MFDTGVTDASPDGTYRNHTARERNRVMWISTIAFTLMFAVWLQFGILQSPLRKEFDLSDIQIAWLIAIPPLNGSIWRLVTGIMSDRWGGRVVMVVLMIITAVPTFFVIFAHNYVQLMFLAFLIGLAGNSFTVGISWNSAWFPRRQQGLALGVFGAGNVGASVTKLIGPSLLAAVPTIGFLAVIGLNNWRVVPVMYAILLLICAALTWWYTPTPDIKPGAGIPLRKQLLPLKEIRVWRFSLYYVVVFGAYVALSGWMPKFYEDNFGVTLFTAGMCTSLFIFPASLLRPLGGWASDKFGARPVMWVSFILMLLSSLLMMAKIHVFMFTILLTALGVGMGIGKAAVYKHIPEYFPKDVGAVGGLVGLLGGLGAVVLPPTFVYVEQFMSISKQASVFGTMSAIIAISMLWMYLVIRKQKPQEQKAREDKELVETSA